MSHGRSALLTRVGREKFDVAIIGGGINGAAAAAETAGAGLRTVLLEKSDFASGTSSRSSRLIHGGIRYLEYGDFGLVFESSRERRILAQIAPHLVQPMEFTWPVYRGDRIPRWKLRAGMMVYGMLSLLRNFGWHHSYGARGLASVEPELLRAGLRGGARYYDAATDDARLVLANVRAALEAGAVTLNYCEIRSIATEGEFAMLDGHDAVSGSDIAVRARVVVNAAGPWSDEVLGMVDPRHRAVVIRSKGSHISLPPGRVGNRGALTLLSPDDQRVIFVIPSAHCTIIGTTETETSESADEVRASEEDIQYLLSAANHFFPQARLDRDDVIAAWSGLRPLAAAHFTGDAESTSREHQLTWSDSRLLSVTGGKLTTYRVVAEDILNAVARQLGEPEVRRRGKPRPLPGGDFTTLDDEIDAAIAIIRDEATARHLVRSHGTLWRDVWSSTVADEQLRAAILPGFPHILAEVAYACRSELACTLADVLLRRTHLAFETRDHARSAAFAIAPIMAAELQWDAGRQQLELERYETDVVRMFGG